MSVPGGHGGHGGSRIMGTGGDHFDGGQVGSAGDLGFERAEPSSGRDDWRKQRFLQGQCANQFPGPLPGSWIVKLARAGVGLFDPRHSAEEVIESVGDQQQLAGPGQSFGRFRAQLVDRVQRHELDAGLVEDGFSIHFGLDVRHAPGRARVAVVERGRDQLSPGIEQEIIHAPRIGADAGNGEAVRRGFLQAGLQLLKQLGNVPVQRVARFDRRVGKPMDLLERQFCFRQRPEHEPAALGAQITSQVVGGHGSAVRCGMRDAGCGMRDAGCGMRDAGCGRMRDAGRSIGDTLYVLGNT